jgi:hypothetical protein
VTTTAIAGAAAAGIASGAAAASGSACYILVWLRGTAMPNRVSWTVFSLVSAAVFSALLIHHAAWPLLVMPGESAAGCTVTVSGRVAADGGL